MQNIINDIQLRITNQEKRIADTIIIQDKQKENLLIQFGKENDYNTAQLTKLQNLLVEAQAAQATLN